MVSKYISRSSISALATMAAATILVGLGSSAQASAMLSFGTTQHYISNSVSPPAVDLTTLGTIDWIHESSTGAPGSTPTPLVLQQDSSGGSISGVTLTGGNANSTYEELFNWSNGSTANSGQTATGSDQGNFQFSQGNSGSVSFNVAASTSAETLYIFAGEYGGSGQTAMTTISASLEGSNTSASSSVTSNYQVDQYQLNFAATTAGDPLTVTITDTNGQSYFAAAALTVPEPTSLALVGIGALGLLLLKRRRTA
ncbi:MAG: PEP-CTERM sorting domain-containing protein [Phycisphaerae bacterium]